MYRKLLSIPIFAIAASLSFSGCASYSDLPAGTHRVFNEKRDGVVEQEIAGVAATTTPVPRLAQYGDYLLSSNDVLYINVSGKPEFGASPISIANTGFKGFRVDGMGNIYVPIAGKITVAGLTLSEAREKIHATMRQYFKDPWIVVEIAEYRNRQIFVFGAVRKPGPSLMPSSGLNLAQAIANADPANSRNFQKVRIIRSNTSTQGELLIVDFDRILRGKAVAMQLQEGDIIYVPGSAISSWNETIGELLPSLQTFSSVLQPFVNIKYLRQ